MVHQQMEGDRYQRLNTSASGNVEGIKKAIKTILEMYNINVDFTEISKKNFKQRRFD